MAKHNSIPEVFDAATFHLFITPVVPSPIVRCETCFHKNHCPEPHKRLCKQHAYKEWTPRNNHIRMKRYEGMIWEVQQHIKNASSKLQQVRGLKQLRAYKNELQTIKKLITIQDKRIRRDLY
ncbi:MAG: hypothetical protein ACOC44_12370 [Promethearchaeia archaeon]